MSQQSHRDDTIWGLIALAPIAIAATLGYAPWALGSVILARLVLLIFAISDTRPGLAARRAAGIFVMLLIPAGLHVYAFYPTFLARLEPPPHDPPAPSRLAPGRARALPALLVTPGAALLTAIGLTYVYVQQRRTGPREHWPQVADHLGQYPAARRTEW